MGGNRAAYAMPSTTHTRYREGDGSGVHSIRRGQPTYTQDNQEPLENDHDNHPLRGVKQGRYNGNLHIRGRFHDSEDDEDDEDGFAKREREALLEREEMRQRFTFQERKRRNLRMDIISAMRRKRRMLMRNENLRFREIYKPPEPGVVLAVVTMVTIVTLVLTKSWPFY